MLLRTASFILFLFHGKFEVLAENSTETLCALGRNFDHLATLRQINLFWMRFSPVMDEIYRVARASDSQCRSRNCPGFDPRILRHSGILVAADETVFTVQYIT